MAALHKTAQPVALVVVVVNKPVTLAPVDQVQLIKDLQVAKVAAALIALVVAVELVQLEVQQMQMVVQVLQHL
jgi:hypothetical protein